MLGQIETVLNLNSANLFFLHYIGLCNLLFTRCSNFFCAGLLLSEILDQAIFCGTASNVVGREVLHLNLLMTRFIRLTVKIRGWCSCRWREVHLVHLGIGLLLHDNISWRWISSHPIVVTLYSL